MFTAVRLRLVTFRLRRIILFNPNLNTDFLNIHYHVGLNDCVAKNFRKAVIFMHSMRKFTTF